MELVSAGGVVYRIKDNGIIEVKLITTKNWRYSLPKGRVEGKLENKESLELTAQREVREESGVKAVIEDYLGEAQWKIRSGDLKVVHIFLMKCVEDGPPNDPDKEILKAEWKTLDDAIRLVDFPPMRKMLILAVRLLDAEKASLCTHCFDRSSILLDWCETCLIEGKEHLEKKHTKRALKEKVNDKK
jgi:8-oxo-dGTP pyrophosphatase MutT (NUDIX family)